MPRQGHFSKRTLYVFSFSQTTPSSASVADYAYEKGFSVRKDYCEWDRDLNERNLRKFVCSSEGFRAEKHLRREIK
jgi:hypothetical protein